MLSGIKPKNNNEIDFNYFTKQLNEDLRNRRHRLGYLHRGKKKPKKYKGNSLEYMTLEEVIFKEEKKKQII